MPLFQRRNQSQRAIADFWTWWSSARPRVEAAIDGGGWGGVQSEVNRLVDVIDPELQWEFSQGRVAKHALIVSPAGDARLRAVAARWGGAAPASDETWEYHTSRQPSPDALTARLDIGGHQLNLEELRFALTSGEDSPEIHVVCHHPAFAQLPEGARTQITFLSLDWLLGENAVELWIGAAESSATPPPGAQPPRALAEAVAALAAKHDKPTWSLLSAEKPNGSPLIATIELPLKSARWPRFDTHAAIALPYRAANAGGLPIGASLDALRAFEDRLGAALGSDGRIVAHETSEGHRTLHAYVDSATDRIAVIETALPDWAEGRATLQHSYDPRLDNVAHLRP
jgi:hypothetical protein